MKAGLPRRIGIAALLVLLGRATDTLAQTPPACSTFVPPVPRAANMFSDAQERALGDVFAERMQRQTRVIDDEALLAPLRAIGARLATSLVAPTLQLEFHLVESPDANAYVLPGGRIYVTRKLVASAHNEDELAGVLAHEIGHLLAGQMAADWTSYFKEVLGATAVTDRNDIQAKVNQILDAEARGAARRSPRASVDDHQVEADRLGLFLVHAAGYDVRGFATWFERLIGQIGPTQSGFLAGLFGRTPPDVKRLRAINDSVAALPARCVNQNRLPSPEAFADWRSAVVSYTGRRRTESLAGVISRTTLTPPLQGDLTSLRFSPDGRYVLAQDTASLSVITRDPFRVAFTIDAPGAIRPRFTPDSQQVVLHTQDLQVQVWSIGEQRLLRAHEVLVLEGCLASELSPDGTVLACLERSFDLTLYDVRTNAKRLERKGFFKRRVITSGLGALGGVVTANTGLVMDFSQDGRFFAAGYHDEGSLQARVSDLNEVLVYDMKTNAPVELSGAVRRLIAGGFAFAGPDRLLAVNVDSPRESGMVALPSGEITRKLPVFRGRFVTATKGSFAIYRPFEKYVVAVVDLETTKVVKAGAFPAVDLYDDVFVAERSSGELALYAVAGNKVLSTLTLPRDDLELLRGAAVSPDLRRLALAGNARGALWDLSTGQGVSALPAFGGGHFTPDGQLYVDVLPLGGFTRQMARVEAATGRISPAGSVPEGARALAQIGNGVMSIRTASGTNGAVRSAVLEMRDAGTLEVQWTRTFDAIVPQLMRSADNRHLLLQWSVVPRDVRTQVSEAVGKKIGLVGPDKASLLEILDVRTGQNRGWLVVDVAEGALQSAIVAGERAIVSSAGNRIHVFALATGDVVGHAFGRVLATTPDGGVVAVENGDGRLLLHATASMQPVAEFTFQRGVAVAQFNQTATELLVLTRDQVATRLTVPTTR